MDAAEEGPGKIKTFETSFKSEGGVRIAQGFGWIPSPEKVSFAFVIKVIMIRIDAHHHLWKYSPETHDWINDDMRELKRDFMPEDLYREMKRSGYDGCVAVQASQSEDETRFLLEQAKKHPFISGNHTVSMAGRYVSTGGVFQCVL